MKSLKDLRNIDLKLSSTDLYFSKVKELSRRKLDFDVWLPSRNTNLQRAKVWTLAQKRELIMSVFLERFIPSICVMSLIDGDGVHDQDIIQVIDGKQRLTTFIDFIDDEFSIEIDDNEYYFNNLPEDYRKAVLNYEIKGQTCYEFHEKKITDDEKVNWFKRINFLGTLQDIEHLNRIK